MGGCDRRGRRLRRDSLTGASLAATAFLELGVWDPARVYRSVKREKGKLIYPELTVQQILWRV